MSPRLFVAFALLALVLAAAPTKRAHDHLRHDWRHHKLEAHSFRPPVNFGHGANWDFGGHASVSDKLVRLTGDALNQKGWLWDKQPLEVSNWELTFEFDIETVPANHQDGDGFAFWYVKDGARNAKTKLTGPVFGAPDKFVGLGIFFDTFQNDKSQKWDDNDALVTAMLGDGTKMYSKADDGKSTAFASCTAQLRGLHHPTRGQLNYLNGTLTLLFDIEDKYRDDQWQECFSVDHLDLPENYFMGFTASTSEGADSHDIIRLTTVHVEMPERYGTQADPNRLPSFDKDTNFAVIKERAPPSLKEIPQRSTMTYAILIGGGLLVLGALAFVVTMGAMSFMGKKKHSF